MKKVIHFAVLLSLLASCGYNNKKEEIKIPHNGEILKVDISRLSFPEGKMLLSDAANDIEIIQLETSEKSIFDYKKIKNIIVDKDDIFINVSKRILRFDRTGKYKNDVGSFGNGPGDFLYSTGIGIDENNKLLYVASNMSIENKVKSYSYDGKFNKTFQAAKDGFWLSGDTNHRESRDYCFVNGYHVFRRRLPLPDPTKENWQIMIRDTTNQLIDLLFDPSITYYQQEFQMNSGAQINKVGSYWGSFAPVLNHYNEHVNFLFEANDTIYSYNFMTHKLFPRFIIHSGNKLPMEELHLMDKSQRYFNDAVILRDLLETKDFFYIILEKEKYSYLLRIDKESEEVQYKRREGEIKFAPIMQINYREAQEPEFINDLCGGPTFYPDHHNAREWIGVYEPEDLLNKMNTPEFSTSAKLPDKKEQLNSLLGIIKEDDNPILFIVKLK